MSPASSSPGAARHRRRAELGARLLVAAEELLADGTSYTQLSVEELISQAGVSRTSFYKTFEGKGDLLQAWLEQVIDEIEDAADAWFSLVAPEGPEAVREALAESVRTYQPHAMVLTAAYESAPFDPAARATVEDMFHRGVGGLRRHVKRGQRAGWVDPELPADDVAVWLTAMNERGFQQLGRVADGAGVDELLDAHARIIWDALYEHAPE